MQVYHGKYCPEPNEMRTMHYFSGEGIAGRRCGATDKRTVATVDKMGKW